jgi:hypothetical protein
MNLGNPALRARARLQYHAGTGLRIPGHYRAEAGDAGAVFHQDVAPGIDIQRAGPAISKLL